jgi:hypothetical protein
MEWVTRGRIRGEGIVFTEPLPLPEDTEVVVRIEPVTEEEPETDLADDEEFERLPFFGM